MRAVATLVLAGVPLPAFAHVKWFTDYQLETSPTPLANALANSWFWVALGGAVGLFVIAVIAERALTRRFVSYQPGRWAPDRFWLRADDFMRAIIAAFFVAIFATGGVYLTPELHTSHEWVSWLQLLIAAAVFSPLTLPFAAVGIMALWTLALREYDLFHLLDYLALSLGLSGYLAFAAYPKMRLHHKRFTILRWSVAIAVMWSSIEKLAFPGWFYPLIDQYPYLTFGVPPDIFVPMAGAAEFTLALGLLWSPLIRRLSACVLLAFFTLAVLPFGRIDLIGHLLIIGVLILIIAEPAPIKQTVSKPWNAVAAVPAGLAVALMLFGSLYWGLHGLFYPQAQRPLLAQLEIPICRADGQSAKVTE